METIQEHHGNSTGKPTPKKPRLAEPNELEDHKVEIQGIDQKEGQLTSQKDTRPKRFSGLLTDAPKCPDLPGFNTDDVRRQLREVMSHFNDEEYEVRFEVQHGDYVTEISLSDLSLDEVSEQLKGEPTKVLAVACGTTPEESLERAVDVAYSGLPEKK